MDKQQLEFKIKHFPAFITGKFKDSVLLKSRKDRRDYPVGSIWGKIFGDAYEPKHNKLVLKTMSVKNQQMLNTCGWNASVAGKEIDEGVALSVKSLVRYARRMGLLSGNGYSYLRDNQKALKDFGCMQEKDLPDTGHSNWETYSTGNIDFAKAEKHKTKSYWSCDDRNDILRTLDEGRAVEVGMYWFSGFNQSGGFRHPWLIDKDLGYKNGAHAVIIIGYDLNYYGKQVYIIQNSYSAQWGDEGKFYVEMQYLDNQVFGWVGFGAFVNLDIEGDIAGFVSKYDGKNVKTNNHPGIFHIQRGLKKGYPNWATFLAWDGNVRGFITLNEEESKVLDKVKNGDLMDITKSVYWDLLEKNVNWKNLRELKKADDINNELIQAIFKMQYNKNLGLPLDNNLF